MPVPSFSWPQAHSIVNECTASVHFREKKLSVFEVGYQESQKTKNRSIKSNGIVTSVSIAPLLPRVLPADVDRRAKVLVVVRDVGVGDNFGYIARFGVTDELFIVLPPSILPTNAVEQFTNTLEVEAMAIKDMVIPAQFTKLTVLYKARPGVRRRQRKGSVWPRRPCHGDRGRGPARNSTLVFVKVRSAAAGLPPGPGLRRDS